MVRIVHVPYARTVTLEPCHTVVEIALHALTFVWEHTSARNLYEFDVEAIRNILILLVPIPNSVLECSHNVTAGHQPFTHT